MLRPIHSATSDFLIRESIIESPTAHYEEVSQEENDLTIRSLPLLPRVAGPRLVSAHLPGHLRGPTLLAVLADLASCCPNLEELYFFDDGILESKDISFFERFKALRHLQIWWPSSTIFGLLSRYMPNLRHLQFMDLDFSLLPAVLDTLISRLQLHNDSRSFSPIMSLQLRIEYTRPSEMNQVVPSWKSFTHGLEKVRMEAESTLRIIRVSFGTRQKFFRDEKVLPMKVGPATEKPGQFFDSQNPIVYFRDHLKDIYELYPGKLLGHRLESRMNELSKAKVLLIKTWNTYNTLDHSYRGQLKYLFQNFSAKVMWIQPGCDHLNSMAALKVLQFATAVLPLATTIVNLHICVDVVAGSTDIRRELVDLLCNCQNIETIVLKKPTADRLWGVQKSTRFLKHISIMAKHFSVCCPGLDCLYMEPMNMMASSSKVNREKVRTWDSLTQVERTMPLLDIQTVWDRM